MSNFYLISIWLIQVVLCSLITFKVVNWRLKRRYILLLSTTLIVIIPWLSEEGFQCGMSFFIPISIYWGLGNIVNFILFFAIIGTGELLKNRK